MPGRLLSAPVRRRRSHGRVVAVLAAIALLVAGCGGDDYQYVSNQGAHLYFRIPDTWLLFDQEELFAAQMDAGVGFPQVDDMRRRAWLRGFLGSADGQADDVLDLGGEELAGIAEVRTLSPSERDSMSLAALRRVGGVDPLEAAQSPSSGVRVLDLEEVSEGDARGYRIVVSVTTDSETTTMTQLALVDAATTTLYRLTLGCSAPCYEQNQDVIDEVTESWTVEEV